ncbi:MAG: AAA family ATPase [Candidatus Aenigmatarchaeota archaeon]
MKIVFATGIAGCGKPKYLKEFEDYCRKRNKKCKVISIGSIMLEIAEELGIKIKEEKILNLPETTLKTLISLAFERALKIIEKEKSDVIFISTHASYWWKNGPENAFDISILNKIKPDIYITFINNSLKIMNNIYSDPKWGKDIINLEEIIIWQEVEVYTTKIFARLQNKPFYVYDISYPLETLYKLIFFDNMKKAYTSFPMTHFKELKKFELFINFLRKYMIVFNPIIEEDLVKINDKKIRKMLENWVVRRDYQLILQSDILVAYFPKVIYSAGVEKEIVYAHASHKEVYLIFPTKNVSPFASYYSDRIFNSLKEFKKFLIENLV